MINNEDLESRENSVKACVEMLCDNNILVLATQGKEGPHTSLMAYCCSHDGREIYMLSSKKSQKWMNLQQCNQVSLLIDDRDGKLKHKRNEIKALTVSGTFTESQPEDEKKILKYITQKNPETASLFSGPDCAVICVKVESFLMLNGPKQAFYSGMPTL
ncbi:pyridoxamine 5'-phosphate oxidase family protein [Maridesulfovibrio zosterae]|uniref:pyridoxamine 5'-phosphate oxidase family protein n=1 Tax=Maridesulfovibrio zosterae TaxID=82171 RepID=UPI0003F73CE3|nr:pyridoxamine 5'-phosphate oxidase family protein [Maridesulfovibrio zosterae]